MEDREKEREILMVMRKVLSAVIRDITPTPGTRYPLTDNTIEDVRMCLGLIAARERELADSAGIKQERPFYADDPQAAKVIPMSSIGSGKKREEDSD